MSRLFLVLAVASSALAFGGLDDMPDYGSHGNGGDPTSQKSYEQRVKEWKESNTKADFISKVKKETGDKKLKGGRADRLWTHMMDLFDNRGVRFADDGGSITYYLPITHHLTFLPDILCEAVEFVMRFLRFYYYSALHLIHSEAIDKHHDGIEWLNKSGWASVITGLCMVYLGFSAISWVIYRFSDGIFPSERAENRETRRLAEEYKRMKSQ